jgi:hypothetical protein
VLAIILPQMHSYADAKRCLARLACDLTPAHIGIEARQKLLSKSIYALIQLLSCTCGEARILDRIFEPASNGTLRQHVVL